MKKIVLIMITGILIFGIFSCTPESTINDNQELQTCCGDEEDNPPPPPPPPPNG